MLNRCTLYGQAYLHYKWVYKWHQHLLPDGTQHAPTNYPIKRLYDGNAHIPI